MQAKQTTERPAKRGSWSFACQNQATVGYALPQICKGTGSHGSQDEQPLE